MKVARALVVVYVLQARLTLDLPLRGWCSVWLSTLLAWVVGYFSFYCPKISAPPGFGQVAPGRDLNHIVTFYDTPKKLQKILALVRPLWYVCPMKKSEKPQRQKANVIRVQELRRSNATSRHKSVMDYRRKPKHPKRGWDE